MPSACKSEACIFRLREVKYVVCKSVFRISRAGREKNAWGKVPNSVHRDIRTTSSALIHKRPMDPNLVFLPQLKAKPHRPCRRFFSAVVHPAIFFFNCLQSHSLHHQLASRDYGLSSLEICLFAYVVSNASRRHPGWVEWAKPEQTTGTQFYACRVHILAHHRQKQPLRQTKVLFILLLKTVPALYLFFVVLVTCFVK